MQRRVHQLDAAHRVDVTDEAEVRVGRQLGRDPAQRRRVDEFVREEDPLDPELPCHADLMRHGEGDAPGAVLDLPPEQLGGHRGLAVRGEGEAVADGVRLHQFEVVRQALGGQREDGGGESAGEEVAALGGQLADGQALGVRGRPLKRWSTRSAARRAAASEAVMSLPFKGVA